MLAIHALAAVLVALTRTNHGVGPSIDRRAKVLDRARADAITNFLRRR